MDRVAPKPEHGALAGLREVVDAAPLPLCLVETLERPGEQLRRHFELAADIVGFLGGVARQARPLLAVHRSEARAVLDKGEVHVFALYEEDVANMACIFESRPGSRSGVGPDGQSDRRVGSLVGDPHRKTASQRSQRARHSTGVQRVVVELAFFAAIHDYIVADRTAGRGGSDSEAVASRPDRACSAESGHDVIGGRAMGFMDKVKAQATVLAEKAQEGAKAGQAKLSDMQAKKHADALLLELGGIVYSQQAGRAPADADAKVSELVGQIGQFESEHGPISVTSATVMAPAAPDGSFVPTSTAAGDTPEQSSTPAPTTVTGGGGIPGTGGIPQSSGGIPTGTYSSDTEESS